MHYCYKNQAMTGQIRCYFSLQATLDMTILIPATHLFQLYFRQHDILIMTYFKTCGQTSGINCNDNGSSVSLLHQQTFISPSCLLSCCLLITSLCTALHCTVFLENENCTLLHNKLGVAQFPYLRSN